jgi:hypothetical protein
VRFHDRLAGAGGGLLLAMGLLAGCGGEEAKPYLPPLEGTFVWEDNTAPRELEGGTVEFEAGGKTVTQAGVRPDGTFMLTEGLAAGTTYRLRVLPPPPSYGQPNILDPRFGTFEKSGLTFTATADGPQQANFKLARKRR